MFDKVLIANRGEIAVRVMRTCKELGIATVAVYSELDRHALHVRFADEAYALGGESAAESYLNMDRILGVLGQSGAQAVHPGYGFYSENAKFARAVGDAGATWVGPPPSAIELMGDKISARLTAATGGVSSVPGTTEAIKSVDDIIAFGDRHGYPIAIKAAYGGGGRGMKVVGSPNDAAPMFESASREAQAYFGRPEAYLERYLTNPRHIEVQIIGDTHGNFVSLGERDCSIQRRHQKLIEETPAPLLSDEMRAAMGKSAINAGKACGYTNAGTVEMLYQDSEFFFLEMNTRLQVEHCVTEMVTGIDLVAEQLRVAAGEPLSFVQSEIEIRGHSIECRINAEDPARGFMPSPGTITKLRAPAGPNVRWDGGYETGDAVSQHYDNLIGKLVVWAPNRQLACARMVRALTELEVDGVHTTASAQRAILLHEDFAKSEISTKWLEQVAIEVVGDPTSVALSEPANLGHEQNVSVEVDGKRFEVRVWLPDTPALGVSGAKRAPHKSSRSTVGSTVQKGAVLAPMQGTIVKVNVVEGDSVAPGQVMCILEAMKMENQIVSESAGVIQEVRVAAGDNVGNGDTLFVLGDQP